jgi:plastocyanin
MRSFTLPVALVLVVAPAALAAPSGARSRSESEQSKLLQELTEQRQLLIRTVHLQQQNIDLLLRMLAAGKVDPKVLSRMQPAGGAGEDELTASPSRDLDSAESPRGATRPAATAPAPAAAKGGSIVGSVNVMGGAREGAVVYVENVKAPSVRDATVVIKQINKQFTPQLAVVQRGTRVEFPNLDTVFHNAFSLSPGNTFDLGTYRAGDPSKSVVMVNPGVVQVFCNMHPQMVANVLVVPNGFYAKVQADGSFKLDGVPPGKRKLVAWMPNAEPISQEIEVVAGYSSEAALTLTAGKKAPHTNKMGQAYGSYKE